jgi:dethiobiotin synthase
MIPKAFFITGTDTDIGKTHVCRVLADSFSTLAPTSYVKPVQTGCPPHPQGGLEAPDYRSVMEGRAVAVEPLHCHVPYRFEPACSPHLAASLAGVTIDIQHIAECVQRIRAKATFTLVEGAGGVLVPLNEQAMMVDLIAALGLAVILVSAPRLGTLNHTLLSLEALTRRGLTLGGVVVNNVSNAPRDFIYQDNLQTLTRAIAPRPLLELDYATVDESSVARFCASLR